MQLTHPNAEVFVWDGTPEDEAIARTTHMCVGAHPDDVEIMAFHGILECFQREDRWFTAVVTTDGAGSPRADLYADYTDEAMVVVRRAEQKKAATVGEYSAAVLLQHPSSALKNPDNPDPIADLRTILTLARPAVIYTHNPCDKHDTHVASVLRTIAATRQLPPEQRPLQMYGCEVWRDLDWMIDDDKVCFDVTAHENLQAALLGIFDSQVCGGKRYDLATLGRRRAHATYQATHEVDISTGMIFAMDLTPLVWCDPRPDDPSVWPMLQQRLLALRGPDASLQDVLADKTPDEIQAMPPLDLWKELRRRLFPTPAVLRDPTCDLRAYVQEHMDRYSQEVATRLAKLLG